MFLIRRSCGALSVGLSLWLAGCGGTVKVEPNSTGSTSAGASNFAGAAPSGGASSGIAGMSSGVGAGGGAPMGGESSAGASAVDICGLPWADGECDAAIQSYWHNPTSGQCELRIYGGCGGNANRFGSLEECATTCKVGEDPNTTCNQASDCELRSPACCGSCEPVDATSFSAVNHSAPASVCNVNCGACPPVEPNQSTSRYFIPGCVAHHCTVVDIRATSITECAASSDCDLRASASCCEACNAVEPIAYNKSIDQLAAFCGGVSQPCPFCLVQIPSGFVPECAAGRCVVEQYVK